MRVTLNMIYAMLVELYRNYLALNVLACVPIFGPSELRTSADCRVQ